MPSSRNSAPKTRQSWDAIVTAKRDRLPQACGALRTTGRVERTGFYNVLAMNVDGLEKFTRLERLLADHPSLAESIASVFPERCFDFSDAADFESKARQAALAWVPLSPDEERAVADALLGATRETGNPARVTFDDPDAIVLVEAIGGRAGIGVRTREDYRQHPLPATH